MKRKLLAVSAVVVISIIALNVVNNTQTNGLQLGNVDKSDSHAVLGMTKPPSVTPAPKELVASEAKNAVPDPTTEEKVDQQPAPIATVRHHTVKDTDRAETAAVAAQSSGDKWTPNDPPQLTGEARTKALACPPDFRGKIYWTDEPIGPETTQEQFSDMLVAAKAKNNIVPDSTIIIEDISVNKDGKPHSLVGAGSASGNFDLMSRTDPPEPGYPSCLDESMLDAIRISGEDGGVFKKSKYFYNPDKPRESVLLVTTHEG